MPNEYWMSCPKFTVLVKTDEREIITEAAPIVRKFVGQPLAHLIHWMTTLDPERKVQIQVLSRINPPESL